MLTVISKTNILDCHGDVVFEWGSGSAVQTFINSFKVSARYLIHQGGQQIAYVDR